MKKFFSILFFFLIFTFVYAIVYLPTYYLDDFKPLKYNEVDIYPKFLKNISFYKKNFYFSKFLNIRKKVEPDFETRMIKISYSISNKYNITQPVFIKEDNYAKNLFINTYKSKLKETFINYLKQENRDTGGGLIKEIVLKIPKYTMPKAVKKFLGGDEAARLKLSGNQNITFSGKDTKTKNKSYNEGLANRNFSLKMQQDLNLNLRGTIGKKIFVNVNHKTPSSDQMSFKGEDKIDIHYQGLEDEVVKYVKAGDIKSSFSSVGSSFSSQGLFGVKADFQIGDLTLNTIIGKDKTQKNVKKFSPNAKTSHKVIQSRDFAKNYFYIDNPFELYEIYNDTNTPADFPEWKDNAFVFNEYGQWIIKNPDLLPAPNTDIHIFVDDNNANNDQFTVRGKNWSDPADTTTYHFDELIKNTDFTYDETTGLIILTNEVQRQYTIGIIYTRRDGIQVGNSEYDANDPNSYIEVKIIKKKNQDKDTDTWLYQCRNIYDLGMSGISPEGFELKIYNLNSDNTENYYYHGNVNYINFLNMDTNGDGKVSGDETTVDLTTGRIIFPFIYPFYALGDSIIYQKDNLTSDDETRMLISINGKIKSDVIDLNTFNLVKNSVVVKLNGVKLKPNIDYIVDYDMGTITLLNAQAMNSMDKIDVEYQEIPLFSLQNKTLIATQASLGDKNNGNFYLNGILGYQSEKVKEERPKIGGENRSIFLAGVETGYKFKMPFLTKLVDRLPLINTDHMSDLSFNTTFNVSMPHIYGSDKQPYKDEAYIDDMESSLEALTLGITRQLWVPASKPYNLDFHKAEVNWFVLSTWHAQDVFDNLSDEEKKEKIPVMTLKIIPDSTVQGEYWGGLMKYLGNQVDLSKKSFIELLIRDENVNNDVNVHIDLGTISEDFYTDYGGEGVLNTEDGKNGGAKNGILDVGEDVGLDGIKNNEEEGYGPNNKDPHNDNFDNKKINNEYPYINRTENNSTLDTEDLNSNGRLDTENSYFEFSFPLSEVTNWYVSETHSGFKYYRIPIKEFSSILSSSGAQPELDKIEYIRIWFDVHQKTKLNIASFNIIGNKWKKMAIRDEETQVILTEHELNPDETIRIGTTDTQKNPHYTQPKQTRIKTEKQTLEQSIFLESKNIKPKHLISISEKLSSTGDSYSASVKGLNLMNYKKLRFLVYAEADENSEYSEDEYLHLYFRICYDSLTYYEIEYDSLKVNPYDAKIEDGIPKMKASNWKQFEINFSDLTKIKSQYIYSNIDSTFQVGKYRVKIVHQGKQWPTLTNVKMLIFGIAPTTKDFSGKVYFDDIRVAKPKQQSGYKLNSSVVFNLADLSKLSLSYKFETPFFLNSASRNTQFSNKKHLELSLTNNWYLGKFFPAEWGLSLPLTISKSKSEDEYIYKANSDILSKYIPKSEQDKQINQTDNFQISLDYSMNKTPRSKILEYTLKKTKLYLDYKKNLTSSPTVLDTLINKSVKYIYELRIPDDAIDIKLWKNYRFYFFPNQFSNTYTYEDNFHKKWNYVTNNDTTSWQIDNNSYPTKTFRTDNTISYNMFTDLAFNYNLKTNRDLNLPNYYKKIKIGVEKERNQIISINYSPNYTEKIFSFSISPSAQYHEDHKKTGTVDTLYYFGNVNRTTNVNVTLKNSDLFSSLARLLDKKSSKENGNKKEKDKEKKENGKNNAPKKFEKDKSKLDKNLEKEREEEQQNETKEKKSKSVNYIAKVIDYFSRISNISFNYTNSYSSSYDRRNKRPKFLYQLGLRHIIPDSLLLRQEFNNNFSFNTSYMLINGLSTNWRYSRTKQETWGQTKNYKISTTFPDLSISFSGLNSILHAEKIIESSSLTSSYVHRKETIGNVGEKLPSQISNSYDIDPLLSWDANWKYGIRSTIKTGYHFQRMVTNNSANQIVKLSYKKNLDFNLMWSFSAPTGIDLPLLKRIHFKNELQPSLHISVLEEKVYNKNDKKHPERWNLNLDIKPKMEYEFSRSIKGGLSIDYSLKKRFIDNSSIRDFTLQISVNITF